MSSCCFQSPIAYLGSGQYWVNISVFDSNQLENNSFSVLFGGLYHFPLPIVVDKFDKPAPCRLDNPNDLDSGSMWTCIGSDSRFRIDTNPKGNDPSIVQLSTKASGACNGRAVCTSTLGQEANNGTQPNDAMPNDGKVSLGALGSYDKGPVIVAFTLSSLVVIGLLGLYLYRNRSKGNVSGHDSSVPREAPKEDNQNAAFGSDIEEIKGKKIVDKGPPLDSKALERLKKDQVEIRGRSKVKHSRRKNLLTVMVEKSAKPKNSGILVATPLSMSNKGTEKIFLANSIDDNQSDQSNVPLAKLYKK